MLWKKLFRTAWNYKAQFLSMIVMIAIGIGIFLGFNIEWKSIEEDTAAFFEQTRYADFRLYAESGFCDEDLRAIQAIDGVEAATRYLAVNVELRDEKKTLTLNVSESGNVSIPLVTDGAAYSDTSDGIWLSDRFAEENGIATGDRMTLVYRGVVIEGEVVGLCKSGEQMICVADTNQLMPDYTRHGFAYISPTKLRTVLGEAFYPQINLRSHMEKAELEEACSAALGSTVQVVDKSLHTAYAGAQSEAEEGKTMAAVLPVLFLAIGILTMVTTMHRIAANEKTQIGTLKALGLRDRRILLHYTSYGLVIGVIGAVLGVALGYGIAALIMTPNGMMGTYFDLPKWRLVLPGFCIPVILLTVLLLTAIGFWSVKSMLRGSAADALRPYTPKAVKKSVWERLPFAKRTSFSFQWNLRDIARHRARSAMTLLGVFGCMLLIVGGLGMSDTMQNFLDMLDETSAYTTKVQIVESAENDRVRALAEELHGDWQASVFGSLNGETVEADIYGITHGTVRFLTEKNQPLMPEDDGVYLCLRLCDTAAVGDTVEFSPYGSDAVYLLRVAGYFRSPVSECMVMSEAYAASMGLDYHISSIYTAQSAEEITASSLIAGKQEKAAIMETYQTFLQLMNLMVAILIVAAVILGVVVLYNLGIMSYVERKRELATLKVLGFRDRSVGRLLIEQNLWLTLIGAVPGLLGGIVVLKILIIALCSEYELRLTVSARSCIISVLLTLCVSLLVGWIVSKKNKRIDMTEALKDVE